MQKTTAGQVHIPVQEEIFGAIHGSTAPAGNGGKAAGALVLAARFLDSGKDRKGSAMNKALAFVVLFAFIFSSCATAPVVTNSQKFSSQVRVYPFAYFNGGYTNTATLAFKDYSSFRILDTKAAESTEDIESAKAAKQSSAGEFLLTTGYLLGAAACIAGAWFIYENF
jgi:hypothetical protein